MNSIEIPGIFESRKEAGNLLSKKLSDFKHIDAVVVGIPRGGVCVAYSVAKNLSLPLIAMPCRKIHHPANARQNIGSISLGEVCMHEDSHSVPQDYIFHQITSMKHSLLKEQKQYYPQQNDLSLKHKTVLLIDDILDTPDSLQACLNEIKKQQPLKIIIAVAVASEESARSVGAEVDEFIYLRLETHVASGKTYFKQYPSIGNKAVKKMLDEFTNKSLLH